MRHKFTRLMMYNTLGFFKIFSKKKISKILAKSVRKKFFLGNFQKFRVRHAIYRFSRRRTRCNRLKIFSTTHYIYINDFVFQISLIGPIRLGGGGQFDPPYYFARKGLEGPPNGSNG